ncbi:MAG: hypothetical protein BJ554DRAFT_8383 [Olpidium bornovanus]|uniref:Uncharacterized protein n=1 Tax=Olpidium bornovanus TaxID=278681 RepID=A0A8H8DJ33_9FUNG|nr:MAG: hypothetical protein BJ554DRAFT_8383 [Olpidium bornovanus]
MGRRILSLPGTWALPPPGGCTAVIFFFPVSGGFHRDIAAGQHVGHWGRKIRDGFAHEARSPGEPWHKRKVLLKRTPYLNTTILVSNAGRGSSFHLRWRIKRMITHSYPTSEADSDAESDAEFDAGFG